MATKHRYLRRLATLALLLGCTWACGKTEHGDSDPVDGSGGTGGSSPGVGGRGSGAEGGSLVGAGGSGSGAEGGSLVGAGGSGAEGGSAAGGGSGAEGGGGAGGAGGEGGGGSDNEDLASELRNREFVLESAEGFTPVEGTTVRIGFIRRQWEEPSEARVSLTGSCNPHNGYYSLCGDRICIDGWSRTDVSCGPERNAQEEWLARFFTSQPALALDGDVLTFTGPDAVLVFRCDDSDGGRQCPG